MARQLPTDLPPPVFRGSPRRLSSLNLTPGRCEGEIVLPKALAPHGVMTSLPLQAHSGGGASVSLSRTTPPGRYKAQLRLGDETVPVELDVAPAPRLKVFPTTAHFTASPGGEASVDVTFANVGNVAVELPSRFVAGIFDDDGLEIAFVEAYRNDSDDPVRLLGSFLRGLRNGYGGLLKLRVGKGVGSLEPGDERTVKLSAHLPETLKPGHSYHGIWKLGPLHYRITVAAQK